LNGGAGSGMDADLLDGLDSTRFLGVAGGSMTGDVVFSGAGVVFSNINNGKVMRMSAFGPNMGNLQIVNGSGETSVVNVTSGNFGLGTGTPTERLHVFGNAIVTGSVTAAAFVGDGSGLVNLPESGMSTNDADIRYVNVAGDSMTGALEVTNIVSGLDAGGNGRDLVIKASDTVTQYRNSGNLILRAGGGSAPQYGYSNGMVIIDNDAVARGGLEVIGAAKAPAFESPSVHGVQLGGAPSTPGADGGDLVVSGGEGQDVAGPAIPGSGGDLYLRGGGGGMRLAGGPGTNAPSGQVFIESPLHVLYLPPHGDISMGTFTNGAQP
jgi:hypothetical protein